MLNQLAYHYDHGYTGAMAVARSRSARKRHVQQGLFRHGGKRKGAGRKPTHGRAGTSHEKRDEVSGRDVLHVVLGVVAEVGSLRRREIYKAVRAASITAAGTEERRGQFRIVQLSIQHNHIHMLVEAESNETLACGMQGFKISAARHINTALRVGGRRRRGAVFADRYHLVVIRSPRQARHVLAYILCNWRKHGEDRSGLARAWLVDPFSSAISFAGWKELEGQPPWKVRPGYLPLIVTAPRSWLLRIGWWRHGAISVREVPSQNVRPAARRHEPRRATRG
ncbi:MAG: transposase [Kofleriaceae bacterium]